jgi:hypothetical protein
MRPQHSITVPATPASALVFGNGLPASVSAFDVGGTDHGERTVHLHRLRTHQAAGFSYDLSGPNCVLRWARVPTGHSGPVDVVVHFHGYKAHNQMRLATKAAFSGLDLDSPGVAGPTLGLVPHGHAFVSSIRGTDGFDFPAIASKAQLDAFIDDALAAFATTTGTRPTRGRVILTGHSGGGAALSLLMRSIGAQPGVSGWQYFDGTYGHQRTPNEAMLRGLRTWVDAQVQRDLALLAGAGGEAARQRLRAGGGHVRICFIDGSGTDPTAKAADRLMGERLQALVSDAAVRALLRERYRALKVANPRQVDHTLVPRTFGGRLLADAASDLSPQALPLAPAPATAHASGFSDVWDEDSDGSAYAQAVEAQDVTVPVLVTRDRASDAPTGSAFIQSLGSVKGVQRETRIVEQVRAGNMPASLLTFHTVRTSGNDKSGRRHEFEFYVTPDVLCIGSESDHVRIPMDPVSAQRVADGFDCLLPTARMVEQLYQAAPTKLAFIPGNYAGTPRAHLQDASSSYLDHSRRIDAQLRRPPTILTAGHKKELVISNGYIRPRRNKQTGQTAPAPMLAFYGAYTAAGVPIQAPRNGDQVVRGLPSFAHEPSFVDYSHGVRLVWPTMKVDGRERRVADILRDPELCVLIAGEGPITDPRYTLDRSGRAAARAQALAEDDDPLRLEGEPTAEAQGYGSSWDQRIRAAVEGFLASFMGIPVHIGSQTLRVHPPYFMYAHATSAQATKDRARLAEQHRAAASQALRSLIGEARFLHARIGKGTPQLYCDLLQAADERGLLQADATVGSQPTAERLRAFLQHYGLGIDCSGFVSQALNKLVELFPNAAAADRIAQPHSTASGALKGGQGTFERVTDPTQLCGGDTMWLSGHIRILAWAERRGERIVFCTAESRSSNPRDIGPSVAYWRLSRDAGAGAANFTGWKLERSGDLNAADSGWQRVNTTHVYGHYRPLRRLLQGAGAAPVALAAQPGEVSAFEISRTAVTRDLTQAEIDRLAAIRFRNAADVGAFFARSGVAGFIDWYNAGLAHSAPFRARGATAATQQARDRYTAFWNQVRTGFDRDEITALDFAAFTAISINETGGHLWAHPERGGRGRSDAAGNHPGLAYFFDTIQFTPQRRKASYNHLSGGRTAGWCFDNNDFIDAHGSLAGAGQLAHHGNDWGGAWNGRLYPQGSFSTAEDAAVNGFIMQADFHKFRGRGLIQTTGRPSYARVVRWIKGYAGSNTLLLDCKRRWAALTDDVACTRSRTEEWDRVFEQPEMLAKGLSLHAGTTDDYRRMSTTAATLLNVPTGGGNPRGQTGSIYAMGRRISGSSAYGSGIYRQRVLALLHGMLAV